MFLRAFDPFTRTLYRSRLAASRRDKNFKDVTVRSSLGSADTCGTRRRTTLLWTWSSLHLPNLRRPVTRALPPHSVTSHTWQYVSFAIWCILERPAYGEEMDSANSWMTSPTSHTNQFLSIIIKATTRAYVHFSHCHPLLFWWACSSGTATYLPARYLHSTGLNSQLSFVWVTLFLGSTITLLYLCSDSFPVFFSAFSNRLSNLFCETGKVNTAVSLIFFRFCVFPSCISSL